MLRPLLCLFFAFQLVSLSIFGQVPFKLNDFLEEGKRVEEIKSRPKKERKRREDRTQTLRGRLLDRESQQPIKNAQIEFYDQNASVYLNKTLMHYLYYPVYSTKTNDDGEFVLDTIAPGVYHVGIEAEAYFPTVKTAVRVDIAQSLYLDLEASMKLLNQKDTLGWKPKDTTAIKLLNAWVANPFSASTSRRVDLGKVNLKAGSFNDPLRDVATWAGNFDQNDYESHLVIKGNNPFGNTFYLEGMPITNPSQFLDLDNTGSTGSLLSRQTLKHVDVHTGTYAAEYGDAFGGVFDFGLRPGNKYEYDFMLAYGVTGGEVSLEGPFAKGKSSFLLDYRYNFLDAIASVNENFPTTNLPESHSATFNLHFALPKGEVSLFGIGGLANYTTEGYPNISHLDVWARQRLRETLKSLSLYSGVRYKQRLGAKQKVILETAAMLSYLDHTMTLDSVFVAPGSPPNYLPFYTQAHKRIIPSLSLKMHANLNDKLNFRAGLRGQLEMLDMEDQNLFSGESPLNGVGDFLHVEGHWQMHYRILRQLSVTGGLYGRYYTLNKDYSVEPRFVLNWQPAMRHHLNLSYGWHSKRLPLAVTFAQELSDDGTSIERENRNLPFIDAHQFSLSYRVELPKFWSIKLEAFGQYMDSIPVYDTVFSFSLINYGFGKEKNLFDLESTGVAYTYGGNLSIEKHFHKNYYLRVSASLMTAKYKGSDSIWRSTAFDARTMFNLLVGRNFVIGKRKRNSIHLDFRFVTHDALPIIPYYVIEPRPRVIEYLPSLNYAEAFSFRGKAYYRFDIKLGLRLNAPLRKLSHHLFIEMINPWGQRNFFNDFYSPLTSRPTGLAQISSVFNFYYQINF